MADFEDKRVFLFRRLSCLFNGIHSQDRRDRLHDVVDTVNIITHSAHLPSLTSRLLRMHFGPAARLSQRLQLRGRLLSSAFFFAITFTRAGMHEIRCCV